MNEPPPAPRARGPWLPGVLVGIAVVFGLVLLRSDLLSRAPDGNDRILHDALVRACAEGWNEQWPVDFWFPSIAAGFPVFAHYQPLSHLAAAAVAHAAGTDPVRTYRMLTWLLLSFVPVLVYAAARRLGLSAWTAALAAFLYPLVRMRPYFGIGWESYTALGSGLTPQAWSTAALFPALAWGRAAIRGQGSGPAGRESRLCRAGTLGAAALLVAACTLTHLLFGYVVALATALAIALPDPAARLGGRLARGAVLAILTFALVAWFALPLAVLSGEVLRSQWEPVWKWNSIGLPAVVGDLATGALFDGEAPVPVLTLLVAAGIAVAVHRVIRSRDPLSAWLLGGFALGLALFAGRATWGRLIDLLPMASGLHLHRFVAMVQAFGLLLAAVGADAARLAVARRVRSRPAAWGAAALAVVVLAVPVIDRIRFVRTGDAAMRSRAAASPADVAGPAAELVRSRPPGRVFAGLHSDWGARARLGGVPFYLHLQAAGLDMAGPLLMGMALPAEWQIRVDWTRPEILGLWGVRTVLAPDGAPIAPSAVPIGRAGPFVAYDVPGSGYLELGAIDPGSARPPGGPRAWPDVYAAGASWLRGPGPARRAYVPLGALPPADVVEGPPGRILAQDVGPGRFEATVEAPAGGDVLLKVTKHPWWRASVDGAPARIVPVYPAFMTVRVPPGVHQVRFRYVPPLSKRWAFGAAAGLAALLAAVTFGAWLRCRTLAPG